MYILHAKSKSKRQMIKFLMHCEINSKLHFKNIKNQAFKTTDCSTGVLIHIRRLSKQTENNYIKGSEKVNT
jgi:hypothetical protein